MGNGELWATSSYLDLDADRSDGQPGESRGVAIYIHVPFCRHLCTYCDFDTFAGQDPFIDPYVEALIEQIRLSPRVDARGLYVGGGTPSLLRPDQAARLIQACGERFDLQPTAEATIEANPSGLDVDRLDGFRQAGLNRLSLGVQSTDDRLLRLLGRRHRAADLKPIVDAARQVDFHNLSVDLIYGVPLQLIDAWSSTLAEVVGWGVEHLSCYMLTVERGTPMERGVARGTLQLPSEDEVVAMYELARDTLAEAGYQRYEISNWARPGHESTHNLAYWTNRPYLGIGAGAASCWGGRRYKIAPDIRAYIDGVRHGHLPLAEDEQVAPRRSMSDTLILGLRLDKGITRAEFRGQYGVPPEDAFGEALRWGIAEELLVDTEGRLRLTERGILLSNELFERLL